MLGAKLSSQLLVFSESASHFSHMYMIYTWEISNIFEKNNANCNLWTCVRKLFKTFNVDNL